MKKTVKQLEKEVRHHNRLYFEKQAPGISDVEFDRLVERLKKLSPKSPVLTEIHSDKSGRFSEVQHSSPMLSLDKCYDDDTLENWMSKFEGDLVASPKIDGCAVELRYDAKGDLVLAATRGNGVSGEDITVNVRMIGDVPKKICPSTGSGRFEDSRKSLQIEIRGEIFMRLSVFSKFKDQFANPRNLAAGAIKQKDPQKTKEYQLSFFAYDLIVGAAPRSRPNTGRNGGLPLQTEWQKIEFFKKNKIPTVESTKISKENARKTYEKLLSKRESWDYETDGVVLKANEITEQERLGSTAHHPRYAIAYKFQGDSGETILKDVEWSVARTGVITPVGIVDPVTLSGASVTRVNLHNLGLMKSKNIHIGAKVLMMRRGGVIPNLESVIDPGKGAKVSTPKKCPSCGSSTRVAEDFLYCGDPENCTQTKVGELKHFVSVVEIDGFGDKLIERLYEGGFLRDPSDFYSLKKEKLLEMERMGDVLAEKLIGNIQARKELPLDLFLRSLGIRELAKHTSKILTEEYGTLDAIFKVKEDELAAIHTFGDVIAKQVVEGLKVKRPLIDKLLNHITIVGANLVSAKNKGRSQGSPLHGKKFLFTGTLLSMSRKEAEKKVESLGGEIASSVTKDLDYLVVGDGGGAGSKLEKAKTLQNKSEKIIICTEKDWSKLITV